MKPVPSPCNGVCAIDAETSWCRGCKRTLQEIEAWVQMTPKAQRSLLKTLKSRS